MGDKLIFTAEEKSQAFELLNRLLILLSDSLQDDDVEKLQQYIRVSMEDNEMHRDIFGLNPLLMNLQTALIAVEEEGLKRDGVLAVLLRQRVSDGYHDLDYIRNHQFKVEYVSIRS